MFALSIGFGEASYLLVEEADMDWAIIQAGVFSSPPFPRSGSTYNRSLYLVADDFCLSSSPLSSLVFFSLGRGSDILNIRYSIP